MEGNNRRGFTLLELLIVISIIAVLSVVVILVLNPSETLKKARDSQRMADLNTLKTAIGLYLTSTATPYLGVGGNSNTGCAASGAGHNVWYSQTGVTGTGLDGGSGSNGVSSISTKTDGTGWIPVNLDSLTGGSPISNLPLDPINTVSATPVNTDLVYRYGCNSSTMQFEIDAALESNAYTVQDDKRAKDGGNNTNLYEVGNGLTVLGSGSF